MITLSENAIHQMTVLGTGLLAEAHRGAVDCTGYQLLTLPAVVDNGDGTFTLALAVPVVTKRPHKSASQRLEIESEEMPVEDAAE